MKQNKYDDPTFFTEYAKMPRSIDGLAASGEWQALRETLPDFRGKRVLDLGCGYGWHCQFAYEHGASEVVGIDISAKMIERAIELTHAGNVRYEQTAIEDFEAAPGSFDIILSSLALHYVRDLGPVFAKAAELLASGGTFCYSVEHPLFTSREQQDWSYDADGQIAHWPVDNYFHEGQRTTAFLGADVVKYHRTVESHFKALLAAGFSVESLVEPAPPMEMVKEKGWEDELRRPMMLILRAVKA
ncbi:class I SAM-dependent methyltransferase [Marinobacter sp. V034]|uniref:class I SAM-dependent methyltransferase n=1 Tax=Marinobacter sp. V034 TaxID=3459610 RepID=UPI00404397EA